MKVRRQAVGYLRQSANSGLDEVGENARYLTLDDKRGLFWPAMETNARLCSIAVLLCAACSRVPEAEPDTVTLYRRGAQLITPYMILADRTPADPTTPQGRSDLHEGIGLLTKVVRANPNNWAAEWLIGKAQQALRNHRAAYEALKQSYATKSDNPNVGRELIIEAICIGETNEAVATARQLSRAHPDDAGLAANAGLALLANGNVKEAKETTERALKMEPTDNVTRALLNEIAAVQAGHGQSSYCPF